MNLPFKADGLLSLFIALVNGGVLLWLYLKKHDYKLLIHTMLSLIIVFVTITIPLQLKTATGSYCCGHLKCWLLLALYQNHGYACIEYFYWHLFFL